MGSDFLLEALMEVPDGIEPYMVVVGVCWCWKRWFCVQTEMVRDRVALLAGCDYTLPPGGSHMDMSNVQMEAVRWGTRLIVAPTTGLKDIVEHGLIDLWTNGKMTVEALVEQGFLEK
ncbi:WAXY, partial [Symbiodinium sp. CCMP2592]